VSRTVLRPVEQSRSRRTFNGFFVAGIAVVLIFALLGVISAGAFVGGRLASGSKPTPASRQTHAPSLALQDVARAQAQATAIIRQAKSAGRSIVSLTTSRANRRAQSIVASARHRAAAITAAAASRISTRQPAANPSAAGAAGSTTGSSTAAAPTNGGVAGGAAVSAGAGAQSLASAQYPTPVAPPSNASSAGAAASSPSPGAPAATPDLSGVPASWRVVGYNATFGGGPGSAGSITVTNRGVKTYSGVARVVYAGGGSASASFSGLAPGQTEVLPLDGPSYGGGGYRIAVNVG